MIYEEDFFERVDELLRRVDDNMRTLFEMRKGRTTLRELSRACGISVAVLSAFFSDSGRNAKKNGFQCKNMLKLAKHFDVSLADIFHIDRDPAEATGHFSDDPNAWNVFIENAQRALPKAYVKRKSFNDLDYVDADPQGNFQKYYQRLIGKGVKKAQYLENVGELYGNPNCELITLIQVMIGLDFDLDLYKWFLRGSFAEKTDDPLYFERFSLVSNDLYADEVIKMKDMKDIFRSGEYQTLIRVGESKEMNERACAKECHELIRLDGSETLQGTVKGNYLYLADWTPLYTEGKVKAGDVLLITKSAALKEDSTDVTYNIYNLTESKRTTRYEDYALFRRLSVYYSAVLQMTFEKDSSRMFISKYFQAEMINANLDKSMDPLGLFIFGKEDASKTIKLSLDPSNYIVNSEENRRKIIGMPYPDGDDTKQNSDEESPKPKNTVRIVNHSGNYLRGLHLDWNKGPLSAVSLYRKNTSGSLWIGTLEMEVLPKPDEEFITDWNMDELSEAIWGKLSHLLRLSGYDEEFIHSYEKKAKRSEVFENLFRSNRLWLEIVIPQNEARKIHWYWRMKVTDRDKNK